MRIPLIEPYRETPQEDVIHIPETVMKYPSVNLIDEKSTVKFIKTVEKIVRSSIEYREYIEYLVNNIGMNGCSFFGNLDKSISKRFKIEIHHEPFTLFDIVSIVLTKHKMTGLGVDFFDICEEVMKIHFKGEVGLLPLSITVHELVHNGEIFIPLQFIDEGFMRFYEEYKPYINDQMQDLLKTKINLSKTFNNLSNVSIQKKFIYIKNEKYNNIPEKIAV